MREDMRDAKPPAAGYRETASDRPEVIREKGPLGKAIETLGYLREIEGINREMRLRLYGPFPESNEAQEKRAHEPSLEEMLFEICQRAAMLAGDSKNLLGKLE